MEASGRPDEKVKGGNMPLIFGISFVLAILLAIEMNFIVIHENHMYSLLSHDPTYLQPRNEMFDLVQDFIINHGPHFRTFKYGLFHGTIAGVFFHCLYWQLMPCLKDEALNTF
jgi:hypothetical protein